MAKSVKRSKRKQPAQHQDKQPGKQGPMRPQPLTIREDYRGSGKLDGRVALVTGGDSGIGRAVAVHFAREGADVAIVFLDEIEDADTTRKLIETEGRRCRSYSADLGDADNCQGVVARVLEDFGALDVLVNNAAQQYPQQDVRDITPDQLEHVFRTNAFSYLYMVQASLSHLKRGAAIINTGSVTSFRGSETLIDYSATKGAIQALTYSLAKQLVDRGVRVNGVAPGPVWTPLIPASFPPERVAEFGSDTPMGRAAQPAEVAPAYVFLASADASFITGHFIHVNGGDYLA